jgi:hypothetical protein
MTKTSKLFDKPFRILPERWPVGPKPLKNFSRKPIIISFSSQERANADEHQIDYGDDDRQLNERHGEAEDEADQVQSDSGCGQDERDTDDQHEQAEKDNPGDPQDIFCFFHFPPQNVSKL